jgi:hypothetical protein
MRTLASPELGHFTVCRLDNKIVATSLVPGGEEQRDEMVGFEKAQIYARNMIEYMMEALLGNESFTTAPETTHSVKATPFCSRVETVSPPRTTLHGEHLHEFLIWTLARKGQSQRILPVLHTHTRGQQNPYSLLRDSV